MVLGKLPVPERPTILITVGQGPIALTVGTGGGGLDILLSSILSLLSPSLWETVRYRLKYCLKGPLNPKQPTNQPTSPYRKHAYIKQVYSSSSTFWDIVNVRSCLRDYVNCHVVPALVSYIQSTLVISKSKGPSKTVRDIRTSTYQICSIEEKTI